jgi:kinesin family protein 6/9
MHGMSQKSVYDECAMPVVKSVMEGCNGTISLYKGTILAYGHNGAGKTFSMTGNLDNYNHRGIIPRAISHIFKEIGEKQDTSFKVKISFFEIYNEQILDLLSDRTTSDNLTVVEESGRVRVKGMQTIEY